MAPREFIPDEKRSLRTIFFISSMILVATTVWALWDEAVTRRPWIKYQRNFKQLEYRMVQEEMEKAKAWLNQPEVQAKLKQLQEERRWAEEVLKGPAYKQAVRKFEEREGAYKEIDQELQFTKSELDEAYYWYDKVKHEGKNPAEELKEVKRLEGIVANLQPRVDAAAHKMEEAKAEIRAFERKVQGIQEKIQEVTAEVTRLERRLEAIRITPIELTQVVVEGLEKNEFGVFILRVDRCQTCHMGIDRPGFENAPQPFRSHPNREAIFDKHPVGRFGCTICHQGQGPALDYEKLVDGRIPDWPHGLDKERGGGVNILWDFPLLRGELVQSSCRQCHLEKSDYTMALKKEEGKETKVTLVNLAPISTKGRAMFEVLGCHGCHPAEGFKELAKVGPELTRIAAKVEPGWLIQWIQNPQSYLRYTRMPNFGLSREEATAIAAYLLSVSEPNPPVPGRLNTNAPPQKGREVFERVGCLGCHTMRAVYEERGPRTYFKLIGRDFAPDLSNVAVKIKDPEWLFRWLKNPRTIRPHTPMPSLRLTDEEASALTAFLMTRGERQPTAPPLVEELKKKERIEEGRRLIAKRGCFGCHDIKGFEKAEKIAPELSNFGHKRLLQLFFGDAVQVHHTWEDWTFWKLKNPQIYATDRVVQLMPNFGFSDEEVKALRALLKSFTDVKIPEQYRQVTTAAETATEAGRRLVWGYNCAGCHVIEGKGGDVRVRYEGRLNEAPPPLVLTEGTLNQGEKVQTKWLFDFVKRPTPIRPWLEVRMPTFGLTDSEAGGLTNYFVALAGLRVPFEFVPPVEELKREMVEAGRILASKEYFSCGACHVQGDKRPEGPPEGWAPDFALARRRLRPEWIITWLKDPQKVQPGTNMPSFFTGPDSGPDNILGGDEEKQILALRDYLMSLGPR
jgi:mono/diheme cytochrome c family protein